MGLAGCGSSQRYGSKSRNDSYGRSTIIIDAVLKFSGMSWDEIGRGLTVMAGALASIVVALNLLPKNIIGTAAGLTVMSLITYYGRSLGQFRETWVK